MVRSLPGTLLFYCLFYYCRRYPHPKLTAVDEYLQASYHTLLSGYARAGRYRAAEQVLTHMELAGLKADVYTYTILIQAYANSKQPGRAMAIYARLKDNNIEPDQAVFQLMLDAFSKAGLVEFAERVVHAMRSHGHEPNAYTMVELIHLYCRVRRADPVCVWQRQWLTGLLTNVCDVKVGSGVPDSVRSVPPCREACWTCLA